MKGTKIPDPDNIARFCKRTQVSDGQIQATAFMLRNNETGLSVNWLECLNCSNREREIDELRNIYLRKNLNVKIGSKIAILNVGEVREKVRSESTDPKNLEVFHDPSPVDPCHSEIVNLKPDDEEIAELILLTVRETYLAHHE